MRARYVEYVVDARGEDRRFHYHHFIIIFSFISVVIIFIRSFRHAFFRLLVSPPFSHCQNIFHCSFLFIISIFFVGALPCHFSLLFRHYYAHYFHYFHITLHYFFLSPLSIIFAACFAMMPLFRQMLFADGRCAQWGYAWCCHFDAVICCMMLSFRCHYFDISLFRCWLFSFSTTFAVDIFWYAISSLWCRWRWCFISSPCFFIIMLSLMPCFLISADIFADCWCFFDVSLHFFAAFIIADDGFSSSFSPLRWCFRHYGCLFLSIFLASSLMLLLSCFIFIVSLFDDADIFLYYDAMRRYCRCFIIYCFIAIYFRHYFDASSIIISFTCHASLSPFFFDYFSDISLFSLAYAFDILLITPPFRHFFIFAMRHAIIVSLFRRCFSLILPLSIYADTLFR